MSSHAPRSAKTRKYLAFISYSSRDQKHAKWLIGALEGYRVPSNLVGRLTNIGAVPRRLMPIFRDRDELRSDPNLEAALGNALDQSRSLIVVCSPNSARPESWVNKEIIKFKASGRKSDILAIIVDGVPHASEQPGNEALECFPKALRYDVNTDGQITDERVEPVAADLLREDNRPRVARHKALLKLISRIIDVEFDELWQRERQRRRRQQFATGAVSLVAAVVLFGLISTGINATRTELSARLAQQASVAVRDTPDTALLLSVAAYNTSPTAAAYGSLLAAVNATEHLAASFHDLSEISALALSGDGKKLAVAGCETAGCTDPPILVYDLETNRSSRAPITLHAGRVSELAFNMGAERLLAVLSSEGEHQLVSLDLTQTTPEPERLYRGSQTIRGAVNGDGALYVVSDGKEFKLFARGAGRRCGDILDSPIQAMQFSPDGRHLALATPSRWIYVVNTADCGTRQFFPGPGQDIAFDASGQFLIATMADSTTTEWDLSKSDSQGRALQVLTAPVKGFLHKLSPDAAYLASLDGTDVLLTNVAERRRLFQLIHKSDSGIQEEDLQFQLGLLQPVRLRGHSGAPRLLRFSADNRMLATADAQGKVLVWNVNGSPLVEGAGDGENAETGVTMEPAEAAKEAVSPDGQTVATVSQSSVGCEDAILAPGCKVTTTLTLRSRETREVIGVLERVVHRAILSERLANRFTPNGDVVTLGSSEFSESLTRYFTWRIEPKALIERACHRANRPLGPRDPEMQGLVQGWRTWLVGVACDPR